MPSRPPVHQPLRAGGRKRPQDNRPTASQRGYGARWQRAREIYLNENPLCMECLKTDQVVPATIVDHVIPHNGNQELFWNVNNWAALCAHHHGVKCAQRDGAFGNPKRQGPPAGPNGGG